MSNGEIAERLVLQPASVRRNVSRILAKLHLRDRVKSPSLGTRAVVGCVVSSRVGTSCAAGDVSEDGAFDAVGDEDLSPNVGCPRLELGTRPSMSPPASEHSRPWSPRKRAIGASPTGPGGGRSSEAPTGRRGVPKRSPSHRRPMVTNQIYFWYI